MDRNYHIFIAYSSEDRAYAKVFHDILRQKYEVFFDWECLLPGDPWDISLPNAKQNSLATVVLISNNADEAYYQCEEIQNAISLNRKKSIIHKIIPVYLSDKVNINNVPYGLRRIHSIYINSDTDIDNACALIGKSIDSISHDPIKRVSAKEINENRINAVSKIEAQREKFIAHMISQRVSKGKNDSECILYIDLDSFTGLNRKYGISVGNEVVKIVQELISNHCNGSLWVRWGGDSFYVLVSNNFALAKKIAKNIRRAIYNYKWDTISPRLYVTASIGIGKYDNELNYPFNLLNKAKEGARLSKQEGGNAVMAGPIHVIDKAKVISVKRFLDDFCS